MNVKTIFKSLLPHLISVIIMILASTAYFYPQLEGKVVQMDDAVSGAQAGGELAEYSKKTGTYYLWSNGQFGGMPKMINVKMAYNQILKVYDLFRLGFLNPIGIYLAMMIFAYIFYYYLSSNVILSIGMAIVTSLSTSNVILWDAGHYSKIATLIFTPLILMACLLIFKDKRFLWGGILLTFSLSASLSAQHPQMTYYIFLFFLVFGFVYLIQAIRDQEAKYFCKALIVSIGAVLLSLSITSTRMWCIYDYSKHSIRGASILEQNGNNLNNTSTKDGLDWNYSTQWSTDIMDLTAAYLVPGFVGGGSGEKVSTKSASYQRYRLKNAPLYWGNLPGTVGPMYLGVSIFFLFVLGLLTIKGKIKWWMVIGVLFLTLLSMGKNFALLNKFLFNYFPMYDKFRAPQSILNTILFYLPVLGLLAIKSIHETGIRISKKRVKNKSKASKSDIRNTNQKLFLATALITLPLTLIIILAPNLMSFKGLADTQYIQQGIDINTLISDRKNLLISDSMRSISIVLLIAGSIWWYLNKPFNKNLFYGFLSIIILFDILGVSKRYLAYDDFVQKSVYNDSVSQERAVDLQIKSLEPDRSRYRIQDLSLNTYNSSKASFLHNTVGGYDPAKLRRYQDLIERHLVQNNMSVYNMLNTKYFIINGQNGPQISINQEALGNAWYVQDINTVLSPNEEISSLNLINTRTTASLLRNEFSQEYQEFNPVYDPNSSIMLTSYEPNKLVYKTNASSDQLAVFSEVWYNGNRDWKSYIDGQLKDHVRVNYILRGMKIPAGQHEIVFEFKPVVYSTGETISLIGMIIFIFIILTALYNEYSTFNKRRLSHKTI